jgi:two-component system response regulator AlgR
VGRAIAVDSGLILKFRYSSMHKPIRTLIVDDEPLAIERLQILCARIAQVSLVGTATDGASALRLIKALKPDLVLLDIQMGAMNGIAVAQALAAQESRPAFIFVTAHDHFAVAAFDVAAVDYLLKPVETGRLQRAIARVCVHMDEPQSAAASNWAKEFWVPHRAEIIRIAAQDIELIEAERDYMRLHVGTRSFLLHETITELERRLDPAEFVRLHRSTLARRDRIVAFKHNGAGAWEAQLCDGRRLRVGRTYLANARAMASLIQGGDVVKP